MGPAESLVYNTEVPCWDSLGLGELGCEGAGEGDDGWEVGCLLSHSQPTAAALDWSQFYDRRMEK